MSSNEKTLVILTPGFAANESDTTCIPMQQSFVRSLKKLNPQLNIIILSFQYPYSKKEYKWFDTPVIPFSGRNKSGLSKLLLRRKVYTRLEQINTSKKIIGLLSFWYGECALAGKRFADKHGLKHYCWIWGQDAKKENKYVSRIVPTAGELVACSDFLQDEFEKSHHIRPQHVVPPGIDITQFPVLTMKRDIDILAAGSLIPLKQYDIFITTIAEIKKQLPSVKAMLIGDGPEKEKLQSLIIKAGLQTTITITGELQHDEVLRRMQRTKVFLHPSSYEGFSGVCLEALAAGAHVISFCKPMKQEIEQWHIVTTIAEMCRKATDLLHSNETKFESNTEYLIDDAAWAIFNLLNS